MAKHPAPQRKNPPARGRGARTRRRDDRNDSVVVIGLGRFGRALALELVDEDTEVLGIDEDAETVQALSGSLTHVVRADSTKEEVLRQLGVHEFDRAVVAIGSDLEASILTASLLVSFGIPHVWAKAISEAQGRILTQLGVHHVVYPEHDMGQRVAHLVRGRMLDYIEFEDDFAMVKTSPPEDIVGLTLGNSGVRTRHGVTVVAVKRPGEGFTYATADTVVEEGDTIIVAGRTRQTERFSELT
ncbi:TrkA family potassium uptake protein [Streptomyces sp. DH37]|uniref:potassium channel family protein n=1 Tax=Streptomyces sp. DH37 TaxID=3040122 RepID=UPI002442D50B|nr:TrkA family potassium uptake protein [Streptomyces sp. DH37]MDG9703242.1 TrkA family potassium uptake protein [Streptomyces sp. DH37]